MIMILNFFNFLQKILNTTVQVFPSKNRNIYDFIRYLLVKTNYLVDMPKRETRINKHRR